MHHVPAPPLSDFVELLWYFRGTEISNARERVLPTGAVDLIFRLDSARASDSGIQGPRTRSAVIRTSSRFELLGVHFKHGGGFPFIPAPVGELHNIGVAVGDLWGERNAERLLSELQDAPTAQGKFRAVERWLLKLAGDRLHKHPAVSFAMRAFCSGPFGSTAEVADKTGFSQRRFIELFRNEVGLRPKQFHRLLRFRQVIGGVQGKADVDWTEIGLSAGYFDQAHLIHDFREFSDLTPEQYLRLRTPFINHVRVSD
jgi:methylphosphotriester-DNA--protein-cysteine methyltransferase